MSLRLLLREMADLYVRENFKRLETAWNSGVKLQSFQLLEITATQAESALKYAHGLGSTPKDVLVTYATPGVTVNFLFNQFDITNVVLSFSAAGTVRALVGTVEVGNA